MSAFLEKRMLVWMGGILCLCYLLPNHYPPWLSFHQELGAALAFAPLFFWACTKTACAPAIAYGVGALAAVPLLQLATGRLLFATDAWMTSLYLLGLSLSIYAGALCATVSAKIGGEENNISIAPFWGGLLVAGLCSAGLALHQWLIPSYQGIYIAEIPPKSRPFGNLAQPNQLATLVLLGTVGLLYFWETRRVRALIAGLSAALLLGTLVMTGSRSVLLAFAWLIPAFLFMRKRCTLRTTPMVVGLAVGYYFLMMWLWPMLGDLLLLKTQTSSTLERMTSPGIRSVIWLSMLDAIWREPWFGYGWGQISSAQLSVALDYPPTYLVIESAHNLFLDLALWNGLPISLALIAGLTVWFLKQIRRCNTAAGWVALVGVAIVFNHSMVEYPLNYAYFLLPVGFLIGWLSATATLRAPVKKKAIGSTATRVAAMVTSTVLAILTITVIVEYLPLEADWALMRFQEARIGNPEPTEPPSAVILTSLQRFLKFSRSETKAGMSIDELEEMRRNSVRFAYAAPMFKYALALALNHQPENALTTLKKMCSMQAESVCRAAKNHWEELGRDKYPALVGIPFPGYSENR
ncbi:O-antigen ligase C-terminal domain-containing protein [Acidovorax sp. ACV02]|uniref:PglL family O-oligosaccharyltransferase n=1 Tax=Acidovorax sp. ACV02 TaxID=2769310 RepID=UPI00178156B3|nr:O-antigen ligase family protein [Acidovorax sp. ACV02]MBD9404658.1 O-antigen ligase C-terminal domain-containing protein [Acidovorax sp. ACV02]